MTKTVLLQCADIQLRFLGPNDVDEVKALCSEWFPVEYPDQWYRDITSNQRFYSLASTLHHRIIGLIVVEIKPRSQCDTEDQGILSPVFASSTQVAYILSLGIAEGYRRNGVASLLLENLIAYLTSVEGRPCKALYLHVLASNTAAINFYRQRNFHQHSYLPYYYSVRGKPRDGFSMVLYLNGGHPPWTILDYMKRTTKMVHAMEVCAIPFKIYRGFHWLIRRIFVPGFGRIAQSTAAVFS